jgi:hypothetical protein
MNLRGDTLEVFDTTMYGRGRLGFDGRRLVWANASIVRNEPYPVVANTAPTAPVSRAAVARVPINCTAAQRCTGSLVLTARHGTARFGSTRFAIPGNTRRTIPIKLASNARRALSRHRSVAAKAALSASSKGLSIRSTRRLTLRR